jgi:capsular exopolysaccharide synthesis family protein
LLAFLIALVVNSELFALAGFVSGRLPKGKEADDIKRLTHAPVLASIPRGRDERATEAFRTLRAGIDLARSDPPVRSLAIVGAERDCGASFVASGLARATANLKRGVVLVDANLRRPVLATRLDIPDEPGLAEIVEKGTVDWAALPQVNPLQERFRVIPAGSAVDDPAGVLGAGALRKTLDQLDDADQIVVDSPAVLESIDALVIASQCDAAILVVDARRTRRRVVENAMVRIGEADVQFLGTVINRVQPDARMRPSRRSRDVSPEKE